jgi:hypothetical protein
MNMDKALVNVKMIIAVFIAGLMLVIPLFAAPVRADDDETSMEAQVEVVSGTVCSYGNRITGMRNTFFPFWALGEPDWRAAYIYRNGWMNIELKDMVKDADKVSIWAAGGRWPHSRIRIYVSKNGRHWKLISNMKVAHPGIIKYDTTGNFGDVKYIRVWQSGGRWSFIRLDAVYAEGGE